MENIHRIEHVEGIAESIGSDIVRMVFGNVTDLNKDLAQFTTGDEHHGTNRLVWKDGNSRYPHINRITGMVGLHENPEVIDLAMSQDVIDVFQGLYMMSQGHERALARELIYAHGPPIPIVKPHNSGKSPGMIFSMQDTGPGLKHNGILCLTNGTNNKHGEIQILRNFHHYYELMDAYYNFTKHSKSGDMIYFDWSDKIKGSKVFNLSEANEVIEEYTSLYNFHVRGIPSTLCREIRWEVGKIFNEGQKFGWLINVPSEMMPLHWETITLFQGDMFTFTSRDVVRTMMNDHLQTQVYLHFCLEPKPLNWEKSQIKQNLQLAYKTGKFGNWAKPGLRFYLRENSTENRWRRRTGNFIDISGLPEEKRFVFGV